jgi:uncharacterized membrane protein YcfT
MDNHSLKFLGTHYLCIYVKHKVSVEYRLGIFSEMILVLNYVSKKEDILKFKAKDC